MLPLLTSDHQPYRGALGKGYDREEVVVMKRLLVLVSVVAMFGYGLLAGPRVGIGTQFTSPAVFGISARGFFTDALGVEGAAFVFSEGGSTFGALSARAMWSVVRGEGAGFYLAGGATLPLPAEEPFFHAVAGIELALPFAPSIWFNTEFGFVSGAGLDLGMAFGVGIHFYFDLGG